MTSRQRHDDNDGTEVDARLEAQREAFIARHDATFDFEAEWTEIVTRAEAPSRRIPLPEPAARPMDDGVPVPAVVDPDRRPGRRRVLVGAGSIAAAAAMVAAIVVSGTDGEGGTRLEARIVTATRSALADSVEHEVTDWDNMPQAIDGEGWRDQTTAAVRFLHYAADGSGISSDSGPVTAPTPTDDGPTPGANPELTVDHCFGEYAVTEGLVVPEDATGITASIADGLAMQLDDGSMRTDGTEVVDGRELIRVVDADGSGSIVYYVDPDTNRPIKVVDPDEGYETTIEYLPRTAAQLAAFTPVIPGGLTEVDQLTRTDDWRPCS